MSTSVQLRRLHQLTMKPTTSDSPKRIVTLLCPALSIATLSTGGPPMWRSFSGIAHSSTAVLRMKSIAPWRFARAASESVSTRLV